jgi:hypothetical protein
MQEWSCQAVEYIIKMSGHIKWIVAAKIVQGERKAKQNTKFFAFYSEPKPIFATSRKNTARRKTNFICVFPNRRFVSS